MEAWLGLIGALAGTAIGGFVTYKVAMQNNSHIRVTETRRRKIEAMEAIYELLTSVNSYSSTLNMAVIGDLGYNVRFKAESVKEKIQFDRLRMLVDFYAPTLKPCVKAIGVQLAIIGEAIAEVILEKNRSDDWKTATVKKAALASLETQKLASEAQEELCAQMQNVNVDS